MPSPSSRRRTVSRSSMTLTEKCLPTSRRNSIADSSDGPRQVVLDDRAGRRLVELDEAFQLAADPRRPLRDGVRGVQGALAGLAGVADHSGRTAGEHDRPMPGRAGTGATSTAAPGGRRAGSARSGRTPSRASCGPLARSAASASRSVDCAISPRHSSSSRMSLPMRSIFPHGAPGQSLAPGAGARGLRR